MGTVVSSKLIDIQKCIEFERLQSACQSNTYHIVSHEQNSTSILPVFQKYSPFLALFLGWCPEQSWWEC